MRAEEHGTRDCEVKETEARAEVERLLSDTRFHATERQCAILRYLAERHFDGHDDGVKAYSIAIDVLGRSSSFEPSLDPIVRIEVSRLRSAVANYYEAFRQPGWVSIDLPKGKYVVVFSKAAADEPAESGAAVGHGGQEAERAYSVTPTETATPAVGPAARSKKWIIPLSSAAMLCVALSAATAVWLYTRPVFTTKPAVSVIISAADQRLEGEATLTRDMLITALTQFQTLTVTSEDGATGSVTPASRDQPGRSYRIDMKYYGEDGDRSVWWQIVDSGSGDLLKAGLEKVEGDGKSPQAVSGELIAALSRRFATTRGVINSIEIHQNAIGALGNACILRAEYELDDGSPSDIAGTSGCLEQMVAAQPSNADAAATLSRVLVAKEGSVVPEETVARALTLADRAVSLAPLSDRAQIAVMMAQFHAGRIQTAISAGNHALALNPNNPDAAAKLGMILFAAGYWQAAAAMAEGSAKSVDVVPHDALLVLALDAYRRGNWSEASLLAEQVNCSDFVVRALRAASLGQLGSDAAAQRLAQLRSQNPDFETRFRSLIAGRRYQQALVASMEEGLRKAGAHLSSEGLASAF
ncbi:hypothetical protein CCGE525_25210 (plasmid) [Rhizobium jaguaris]|uniref:Tetratricopeptide repeat protein n=2 Tax=Rhizobium jaguaris TaxID=1312183 RepID=A0A387FX80_9HYPH|nr:hypothetical protein [Rhizobium jaguaris]AYG63720.1 hypothetical protein CCGE525_25210 [Rhizobium jaguaris]